MFTRSTRYDYYWPCFAHLGEQAILNEEIFAVDGSTDTNADGITDNKDVFGYQERWAEYRYAQSKITGLLRSEATSPIDEWHLSQEFASTPTLSDTFIKENEDPLDRAVKTPAEDHFIFDSRITNMNARPIPVNSIPGLTRL